MKKQLNALCKELESRLVNVTVTGKVNRRDRSKLDLTFTPDYETEEFMFLDPVVRQMDREAFLAGKANDEMAVGQLIIGVAEQLSIGLFVSHKQMSILKEIHNAQHNLNGTVSDVSEEE